MIDLKEVVEKYPECLQDAKRLKSMLYDLYPQEKLYAGILASILDDGIVKDIQGSKEIDVFSFKSYCKKIEAKHGFAGKYIEGCLNIWANAFGVKINTPPIPQKNAGIEKKAPVQAQAESSIHTHIYVDTVVSPSCTEKGYTLHTCDCGYEYKDSFTNAQHDYILIECSEPTCEKDGQEIYKCCCCGVEEKKRIPATGHKFGPWIEQERPSCTTNGYEVRECSICGKKERRTKNKTGHKFSPWRKEGEDYVRDCEQCGCTQEKSIPIENVGQMLEFGRYPQTKTGKSLPIKWEVMQIESNHALLLSNRLLDGLPYDPKVSCSENFELCKSVRWSNSFIRSWLNSTFFEAAFSLSERKIILKKAVHNNTYLLKRWYPRGSAPSALSIVDSFNTDDFVFLLSVEEIEKFYHIKHDGNSKKKIALANVTDYAKGKGPSFNFWHRWALRDTQIDVCANAICSKDEYGPLVVYDDYLAEANFDTYYIRPALWIDMTSSKERAKVQAQEEQKHRAWELAEAKRREEQKRLEQQRLALEKERREKGVCQYCGGEFKGLFIKKCAVCGQRKDY